ncbi:MAG: hypothetical protein R3B41_01620 [Candidatus Doudnabacteria bacterium]
MVRKIQILALIDKSISSPVEQGSSVTDLPMEETQSIENASEIGESETQDPTQVLTGLLNDNNLNRTDSAFEVAEDLFGRLIF